MLAKILILAILGCLLPSLAVVWEEASGAPQARPTTTGPIITDTAEPVPPGSLQIQPSWQVGLVQGNFSGSWQGRSAGGDFICLTIPVQFTYGLAPNLEIKLMAPYVHNWAGNVNQPGPRGERGADFGGLGDINLFAKYQLLAETAIRPTVSGVLGFNFPTGRHVRLNPGNLGTDNLGGGTYGLTLGVNLSKWVKPLYLYANLWYSLALQTRQHPEHQALTPLITSLHEQDQINFNLAAEWVLTPRWVLLLEFYSIWEVGPLLARPHEPPGALLGILPGIECILSPRWSCALGVALDLAGKNTEFKYTPVFTVLLSF
ncbi:MAG: transporter [Deltaproteobacteria bacterium]|nr:transporter [Deltaproteobacteria bacterium]